MPETYLWSVACRFQRKAKQEEKLPKKASSKVIPYEPPPYEAGLAIGRQPGVSDINVIVDGDGKVVPFEDLWDYHLDPTYGSMIVTLNKIGED